MVAGLFIPHPSASLPTSVGDITHRRVFSGIPEANTPHIRHYSLAGDGEPPIECAMVCVHHNQLTTFGNGCYSRMDLDNLFDRVGNLVYAYRERAYDGETEIAPCKAVIRIDCRVQGIAISVNGPLAGTAPTLIKWLYDAIDPFFVKFTAGTEPCTHVVCNRNPAFGGTIYAYEGPPFSPPESIGDLAWDKVNDEMYVAERVRIQSDTTSTTLKWRSTKAV